MEDGFCVKGVLIRLVATLVVLVELVVVDVDVVVDVVVNIDEAVFVVMLLVFKVVVLKLELHLLNEHGTWKNTKIIILII